MANYIVTDTDLTAIANKIRARSGKTATMSFPSGFTSELNSLVSLYDLKLTTGTVSASANASSISSQITLNQGQTRTLGRLSFTLPTEALRLKSGAFSSQLITFSTPTVTGLTITETSQLYDNEWEYRVQNITISGNTMGADVVLACTSGQIKVRGTTPQISAIATYKRSTN